MAQIITRIILDDDGGQIRTFTRGFQPDDFEVCEKRSIVFALASICRESPLGFEACLEGIEWEAMNLSRKMGKKVT